MSELRRVILGVGLLLALTACNEGRVPAPPETMNQTIAAVAKGDPRFERLAAALEATGLDGVLDGAGPFTVFAPTNAAFDRLPGGLLPTPTAADVSRPAALGTADLREILRYHVIPGLNTAEDVVGLDSVTTDQGTEITIQVVGDAVVLNGRVQVTSTNIMTANGVIHVLDAVLVPGEFPGTIVDALAASPRFDSLVGAVVDAGLAGTLSGVDEYTVFAPTNDAFAVLPEGLVGSLDAPTLTAVLLYHVVAGDVRAADVVSIPFAPSEQGSDIPVQVDGETVVLDGRVQVTFTDIVTSNGVIHVIDSVLVPGGFPGTIVDMLAASPRFSTLTGGVVSQSLAGTLATDNGGDGFTVFAPTNAAFERLPVGLVGDLAGSGVLPTVLLYHVLGSTVDSTGAIAAAGTNVPTLATGEGGAVFSIGLDLDEDPDLFIDGRTQVTFTDIVTTNGIVHVLDSVLVPGGGFPGSLVEALSAYPRFDILVGAVVDEGLAGAVTEVTVFAPTNDAFLEADLSGLVVAEVLAYHVLPEPVDSTMLMSTEPTLLQGSSLSINSSSGVVIDGTTNVIRADIVADDGIIHVIDEVLVPTAP